MASVWLIPAGGGVHPTKAVSMENAATMSAIRHVANGGSARGGVVLTILALRFDVPMVLSAEKASASTPRHPLAGRGPHGDLQQEEGGSCAVPMVHHAKGVGWHPC